MGAEELLLACPFFLPESVHPAPLWPHRRRLPLGDGFAGRCGARTQTPECGDEELRTSCNLGYSGCVHLPAARDFDAVRFLVRAEGATALRVEAIAEREHLPALRAQWRYDLSAAQWDEAPDGRLLLLANAALRAWLTGHS